jgi:hypothetical protein
MGEGDLWASFSNYGNPPVDFCEPGVDILSCYKGGLYATMSGTSMASPHMAGILLWGDPANGGTVNNDPDKNNDIIGVVGGTTTLTGSIGGTVKNSLTDDLITEATITVANDDYSATTETTNGSYSFSNIPVGIYTVTASATGYNSQSATGVAVSANTLTIKDFSLVPVTVTTYTVSGTVKDGSQAVIIGAKVELAGIGPVYTDSNGNYSIGGVPPGDCQITASAVGFNPSTQNISVNDNMTVNFTLQSITGSDINLTAVLRKERGIRFVDLTWSGADGDSVIVKVNGSDYATIENDESETFNFQRSSGTFTFQVCETGGTCSNIVTLLL